MTYLGGPGGGGGGFKATRTVTLDILYYSLKKYAFRASELHFFFFLNI